MMATLLIVAVAAAPALHLDDVLAEVGEDAPAVRASRAEIDVARERVGVAGAWEDPSLLVMAEQVPLPGGESEEPTMISYRFSQTLNVFGRRGLAKRAARADVDVSRARTRRTAWNARSQAVTLFYELWMNDAMGALIGEQLAVLDRMREAALARIRAGMDMGHHDVLRAESEIATMEAERASLADEREAMVVMLNTLRGRPLDDAVGEVVLPAETALPETDALSTLAKRTPEVEASLAMRAGAEANVTQARRMYLPMIMVMAEYEQNLDGMPDGFGVGVSLTIPLWWRDRQRNEVEMARAMVTAAARDAEAMEAMAAAELRMGWSRVRAVDRRLTALVETAIPRMRETIASSEEAYIAGSGEFLSLLEAVMALQRLEGQRLESVARRGVARFELDRIAGAEVSP